MCPVNARRECALHHGHGLRWFLDERGLRDFHRLGGKNLWQRGRIAREVKAALSAFSELAEECCVLVLLGAECDDARGDFCCDHRRHKIERCAAALRTVGLFARALFLRIRSVREKDDVFDARVHVAQCLQTLGERSVDVYPAAARRDAEDFLNNRFLRSVLCERGDNMSARVHREHAEVIARTQHIQRERRALVGERHFRLPRDLRGHRA